MLLAGPHIFRKYYSIEFSQVIIFHHFSHYSYGFISLFPPKYFVLTILSIEMSLYLFGLLLFVSLILVAETEIKTPICKHLWRIHPKQTLGPVRLSDNSVKFCTQVCEEMPKDV